MFISLILIQTNKEKHTYSTYIDVIRITILQMAPGGKAVIAFRLVDGFLLIHHEGKLSLPLG